MISILVYLPRVLREAQRLCQRRSFPHDRRSPLFSLSVRALQWTIVSNCPFVMFLPLLKSGTQLTHLRFFSPGTTALLYLCLRHPPARR